MGKRVVVVMAALAILSAIFAGRAEKGATVPVQKCTHVLAPGESC